MLWKTDEKALLEKRAEERGKLMLRGRSAARQAAGRKVSVCAHGGGHRRLQDLSSRPPEVAPSHEGWDGVGVPCDPREGPPPGNRAGVGAGFPDAGYALFPVSAEASGPLHGPRQPWGGGDRGESLVSGPRSTLLPL